MYTLKSIVRRGTALGAAVAVFAAAVVPSVPVFADALNPLTERSLLLTSSAPGYIDTDGSNYSVANPNPASVSDVTIPGTYAPAGSGPNGKKTGETFTFKVSSTADIEAFTLQYCTTPAGKCRGPGNNTGDADPNSDGSHTGSTRVANGPVAGSWNDKKSDLDFEGAFGEGAAGGNFQVFIGGVAQSGWSFAKANKEDPTHTDPKSGKNNYITLSKSTPTNIAGGTQVTIVFKPSESVYITNPGEKEFFVKINSYDTATTADHIPGGAHNIDGGVTVANVMTDSIHITTKVLETMAFSVGTQNPDAQNVGSHGSCDAINVNDRLELGDSQAENSLKTDTAYDTYSYWRLSSNSSGGATVYYSGNTLANTVGDEIKPIGANAGNLDDGGKDYSHPGTEQFGLALVDPSDTTKVGDALGTGSFPSNHITPTISPLVVESDYADGDTVSISDTTSSNNAQFAFKKSSSTIPALIAQENTQVISCATSKIRYVANIAADTPAGVYTTKINYLAAPQY